MTRPQKTRPIILRCTCGEMLQAVNAAGENFVFAERHCAVCALYWTVELEFTGWNDLGGRNQTPVYKVKSVSRSVPMLGETWRR